ncbi:DUF2147 domain-containing protein [Flavobacterium sp. NRK F10]|uniref:DUF2147 domain-containing protein n=1 Tax=Flavobacterium sp. NRK F10 TaxID=2954931 RepID=UPI0020909F78|nr:DUF2147 domain-containing protein [Flavobacterium sp. NRK F10]MCO6175926.1 DUF2147 domain-containing protein [Flavobacterium sp. NRK F10]
MKKSIIITLFISIFSLNTYAQDNLLGTWKTDTDNTLVKIEKQGNSIVGKVISSDNKEAAPGTVIIKETKYEKGILSGQLYLFKKKRWFQTTFEVQGNKLKVTGKLSIMSHTVHWTKVTSK